VKLRDVKRCEAIGHLHVKVEPAARKKFGVDEAFSDRAIYDGASNTLFLPDETRTLTNGQPGKLDTFSFKLDEAERPSNRLK
jgi:hypothetical protein